MTQIALDYRMEFHRDVVVDIVCFRKLGHNEQDTPSVTQPLMYKRIAAHPGTRKLYADKLAAQGVIADKDAEELIKSMRTALDAGQHTADPVISNFKSQYAVDWVPFLERSASPRYPPISSCIRWWRRSSPIARRWAKAGCR